LTQTYANSYYRYLHLSTPFWEFLAEEFMGVFDKMRGTFYSLLGVSLMRFFHALTGSECIFLLPFGSFLMSLVLF